MRDIGLDGSVVIVTGAAGGIGSAACAEFLEAGAAVVAVDIDANGVEQTVASLAARGTIEALVADLSNEAAVRSLIEEVQLRHFRIDVLFNNASIEGAVAPLIDYPTEIFDRVMAINVRSIFLTMKYVLPGMVERKSGAIVNMGSTASFRGPMALAGYTASKHAVIGLTRTAAGEVARSGVRVNALCPGPTDTRMMESIEKLADPNAPTAVRESWINGIPRGQYGEPHELARVAVILASPLMANVTGATWLADGGLTAI